MAKNAIIISLVFALLLLGCTGTPEQPPASGDTGTGDTGAGTVPAGDSGTADAGTGDTGTSDTGTADTSADDSGGLDFTGLDYAGVMALGVPVQCDITITEKGQSSTVKLYAVNENEIREEIETEASAGSDCDMLVVIVKSEGMYMGCKNGDLIPESGCDWLFMETSTSTETEADAMGYEVPDYAAVPAAQISCMPWIYDASMFQTPGKSCTFEELMQQMMAGYEQ